MNFDIQMLVNEKVATHTNRYSLHASTKTYNTHAKKYVLLQVNAKERERKRVKKLRKKQHQQHTFIFTMALTPKVWAVNQSHAYSGKNANSKILVKKKLPVPPPIKKWGRRQPKQMRG